MHPVAMIVGQTLQVPRNERGHGCPMIAIPRADDCSSLHLKSDFPLLGQKGVKVGGFKVPTQDVSGVLGSVRNDVMTAWAHGD